MMVEADLEVVQKAKTASLLPLRCGMEWKWEWIIESGKRTQPLSSGAPQWRLMAGSASRRDERQRAGRETGDSMPCSYCRMAIYKGQPDYAMVRGGLWNFGYTNFTGGGMDLESLNACPLCGTETYPDRGRDVEFCECEPCGYLFDNPRPTIEELVAFYSRPTKYDSWLLEAEARDQLWERRLKQVLRFRSRDLCWTWVRELANSST